MRNDELYIDGKLVDLDDSTKITLNYKSNIFTDLSKIVSNSSYTIKLPTTVHNQCVIEHADLPAYRSDFPWSTHASRYFRNGVEIIRDAFSVLISSSGTIDIALTWGNVSRFNELIKNGLTLQQLDDKDNYLSWNESSILEAYNSKKGYFFSKINFGIKEKSISDKVIFYHPVVRASWIIDRIAKDSGLVFEFPDDRMEVLNQMIIPLLTRNDSEQYAKSISVELEVGYLLSSRENLVFKNVRKSNHYCITVHKAPYQNGTEHCYGCRTRVENGVISITGKLSIKCYNEPNITRPTKDTAFLKVWKVGKDESFFESTLTIPATSVEVEGQYYFVNFDFADKEISGYDYGDEVRFSIDGVNWPQESGNSGNIAVACRSAQIGFGKKVGDIFEDGRFFIVPNLPAMKQLDFIKTVCYILGLFAIPVEGTDNFIKFASVDDIYSNIPKARNWTKLVAASSWENKPKELCYSIDGFAQNNVFKYKEDKSTTGNYDGSIVVHDTTLEYSRDLVILPFAGSDTRDGVAYVPVYSYKDDDTIEYTKAENRILIESEDKGVSKGVFTGMDFASIIKRFYEKYAMVVDKPKIIKEKIQLKETDVKTLDMTVPIYLAQYGQYYAIVSVKAEDSGVCGCELLQLDI